MGGDERLRSKRVTMVSPPLGNTRALLPVGRTIVNCPNLILIFVGEMTFDCVLRPETASIGHAREGRSEAMGSLLILGVAQTPECSVQGVLGNWSIIAAKAWE